MPLHTNKIIAEKDAFVEDLYDKVPRIEALKTGELAQNARRLHAKLLPAYIMKHYVPAEASFQSAYLKILFTGLIEGECGLILGLTNSAMSSLRFSLEASIKFLYYEFHTIENILHEKGRHDLTALGYREFLYSFPGLSSLSFLARSELERLWTSLCSYVHCDIRIARKLTVVTDVHSSLAGSEASFSETLKTIENLVKVIITILWAVRPNWAERIEKAYYDAILEAFSAKEVREIREQLRIS